MEGKYVKELGEGNITMLMFKYSVPTIFATIINAAYNIVDRIFVGRACGEDAIAAITVCFSPTLLLLAVGMTIGVGTATITSIKLGQKKYDDAEKVLGQAFFLFAVFCILVALYMLNFMPQTLMFLGATERILPDAVGYYSIIICGLIFEKISFGINNVIRAEGRPVYAMTTLLIGGITNVVLDYIFIFKLKMGVRGAALATIMAQACGTLWVLWFYFGGKSFLKLRLRNFRIFMPLLKSMLSAGSPSFVIQFLTGLAVMVFVQQARNYGSESALAIIGVNTAVITFMFLPIVGISMGIQPIVGYNWGLQNYLRVKGAYLNAILAGAIVSVIGFLLCQFGARLVFDIFLGADSHIAEDGVYSFRIVTAAFAFISLNIITSGYFQSTKRPIFSILITVLRQVVLLMPLLVFLPKYFGITGVWLSYPISDFVAFVFSAFIAVREFRRINKRCDRQKRFFGDMFERYFKKA